MQIHGHLLPENGLIDSFSVIVRIAEAGVDGIAPQGFENFENQRDMSIFDDDPQKSPHKKIRFYPVISRALRRIFRDHFGQSHRSEKPGTQRDQILSLLEAIIFDNTRCEVLIK